MSLRSSLWRYLGLLAVAALAVGAFAGPASAKKLSSKQRAAVRTQLKKEIKKNPKAINRKSFIKRASLVNFKLPVTLRLRGANAANGNFSSPNPNQATVDLGASLGTREVRLGGSLSGEITFHDSYDGGALGNVDLAILPSANHQLTSTSIPLLWNSQVSTGRFDANDLGVPEDVSALPAASQSGCGNFTGASLPFGPDSAGVTAFGPGLLGYPYWHDVASINAKVAFLMTPGGGGMTAAQAQKAVSAIADGFLPIVPGVDDVNNSVKAGEVPGNDNIVGPNPNPFPAGSAPTGFAPTAKDTVLRTNALKLNIATAGTAVNQSTGGSGPEGSQDITVGKSGGQANLFGKIPGKSYGIDITVNLATRINSILRMVDQDSFHTPLISGQPWPAGVFNCRQIWTGGVQNYIPSVRLAGNLKIAPGLTADGHLRIAKATVNSQGQASRFAVAACLAPYAAFDLNNTPSVDSDAVSSIPDPGTPPGAGVLAPLSSLPVNNSAARTAPSANCNADPQTALVKNSALGTTVPQLVGGSEAVRLADGYTTTSDGSKVSVGADLSVGNVTVDVLIGDVS